MLRDPISSDTKSHSEVACWQFPLCCIGRNYACKELSINDVSQHFLRIMFSYRSPCNMLFPMSLSLIFGLWLHDILWSSVQHGCRKEAVHQYRRPYCTWVLPHLMQPFYTEVVDTAKSKLQKNKCLMQYNQQMETFLWLSSSTEPAFCFYSKTMKQNRNVNLCYGCHMNVAGSNTDMNSARKRGSKPQCQKLILKATQVYQAKRLAQIPISLLLWHMWCSFYGMAIFFLFFSVCWWSSLNIYSHDKCWSLCVLLSAYSRTSSALNSTHFGASISASRSLTGYFKWGTLKIMTMDILQNHCNTVNCFEGTN